MRTSPRDVPPATLNDFLVVSDLTHDGSLSRNLQNLTEATGETPAVARDFFTLAGAVYVADKKTPRRLAADAWTREFDVRVPVADPDLWRVAAPALKEALDFLTGDRWRLRFRHGLQRPQAQRLGAVPYDMVALFSGGLDSLIGAIDTLATGQDRMLLVGHHDSNLTQAPQDDLFLQLSRLHGKRVAFVPIRAKPFSRMSLPYPLPRGNEITTRSRSFLFIAIAMVAAAALGDHVPIRIPENGLIALNVPLVPERSGSSSTRTTHPFFLRKLRIALDALGLQNSLSNPYLLRTKGEMMAQCADQSLLRRLASRSVSCAHSEQGRFDGASYEKNCGYCYPCLIRRAAFNAVRRDRSIGHYRRDAFTVPGFVTSNRGADLRAVLSAVSAPVDPLRLSPLWSGPLPDDVAREDLANMHRRGLDELRALVVAKGSAEVKRFAGLR